MSNVTKLILTIASVIFLVVVPTGEVRSATSPDWNKCSQIDNDAERLKCYDALSGRASNQPAAENVQPVPSPEKPKHKESYLTKLWQLDKATRQGAFSLMPHRSNYILPLSYNSSPNREPFQAGMSGRDIQETEVKLQLSLKVKLWEDILNRDMDLWFGYTQKSFWQLYNFKESAPFRETDYEPELLLNFRTNYHLLGLNGRTATVGFNHQSNGRSDPYSRSWNRIVGNLGFERDNFTLLLKTWCRLPESAASDDNPDLEKYMGYGEVWAYYFWKEHRFGLMLRDNLRTDDNRGALQLEWSFPLLENVSGHIQYFVGYGENLLDYNHSVNRIGIGFIIKDWD